MMEFNYKLIINNSREYIGSYFEIMEILENAIKSGLTALLYRETACGVWELV